MNFPSKILLQEISNRMNKESQLSPFQSSNNILKPVEANDVVIYKSQLINSHPSGTLPTKLQEK